ncbi:glucosyl-dolichyl phosphate glucuronosyltransferase [Halopiger thermotolerans]
MFDSFTDAVGSIFEQTYDDIELVLIVDGTQSVFERVCDEYGDHSNVITHCNDENSGLLKSRNRGAELASGDIIAFMDDDAIADERWIEEIVQAYEERNPIAVGGRMEPLWVADKPTILPEEFYWLVGVTHEGFADGPGEVRNTFGSNITFRREVFLNLGGFDTDIGGRKGDKNLQGGETELCARMRQRYGQGVWYVPEAKVGHKVFDYRTDFYWLLKRAFWQGYSKRAMEVLVPDSSGEEADFLSQLLFQSVPRRLQATVSGDTRREAIQLVSLLLLTGAVGLGYLYAFSRWR